MHHHVTITFISRNLHVVTAEESVDTYSGKMLITLRPNLLWHTGQTLSSDTTTLRFLLALAGDISSPRKSRARVLSYWLADKPRTAWLSVMLLIPARRRPRKYDSSSSTGSEAGIKSRTYAAGIREPCLDRRFSAGARLGLCGGGGDR